MKNIDCQNIFSFSRDDWNIVTVFIRKRNTQTITVGENTRMFLQRLLISCLYGTVNAESNIKRSEFIMENNFQNILRKNIDALMF